jgi:hydrogenase maturation protease
VPDDADKSGTVLVIGYGNRLRGDDGMGPRVAEAIAARGRPGVRVLTPRQLVPELAADLAGARLAVFVDARAGAADAGVAAVAVGPGASHDWTTHAAAPPALLALTFSVFGRAPAAWWVTVPGWDFGLREGLSPLAQQAARAGVERAEAILRGEACVQTPLRQELHTHWPVSAHFPATLGGPGPSGSSYESRT